MRLPNFWEALFNPSKTLEKLTAARHRGGSRIQTNLAHTAVIVIYSSDSGSV